ncbi:hypothetical protein GCM10012275_28390 [Longimycelium tulufanense]|uniref:Uncharacterized protein n=1 Tax=Longimycelium tulufanense TaxID=907463 RepID=A0A8J3C8F4_9PSEU|nr:hypothetical protein [Longimycelium tulufanense]GGM55608.1 hypothetical protein GCM10012275_28390 [Longimycelium tulufanense]
MSDLGSFIKDPDEVLTYVFDWGEEYLAVDETITTSKMKVTGPAGINVDSETNDATTATVQLSGGVTGFTYRVSNKITTSNGITAERSISITIEQR